MSAKLYAITKPLPMWQVVYLDFVNRDSRGRPRKMRKHFLNLEEAKNYQRELNRQIAAEGMAGVNFDANVRADAIAARRKLDLAGHLETSLLQLANLYTEQVTGHAAAVQPIAPQIEAFLEDRRNDGLADETVKNLSTRLWLWVRLASVTNLGDISRASVEPLRARKAHPQTRRNDLNAVSAFCTWLMERQLIPYHPLKGLARPKVPHGRKPVFNVEETARVLTAARTMRQGKWLGTLAVLLWTGSRPSEIEETRLHYGRHPFARIEGGKLKGRANRTVPLMPAALAWLKAAGAPASVPPLSRHGREEIATAAKVHWAPDICRHTFISNRAVLTGSDALTAREAGTSEAMIHRHYLNLRTRAEARKWAALRPSGN